MLHNIDATTGSNFETTLNQCCISSVQPFFNVETNLASEKYGFAESLVSFILLNEKKLFTIYCCNHLAINKSLK